MLDIPDELKLVTRFLKSLSVTCSAPHPVFGMDTLSQVSGP